jgi:hypothetical protein
MFPAARFGWGLGFTGIKLYSSTFKTQVANLRRTLKTEQDKISCSLSLKVLYNEPSVTGLI